MPDWIVFAYLFRFLLLSRKLQGKTIFTSASKKISMIQMCCSKTTAQPVWKKVPSSKESWLLLSGEADMICTPRQLTWLPGDSREALPHASGLSVPNLSHRLKCLNNNAGKTSEVSSCYVDCFHSSETKMGGFRYAPMLQLIFPC